MALKDLVAQKGSLDEAAIEEIVSEYVRYDPEAQTIAFIPGAADLPNRAKVLVYLVALQGWPFVTDAAISVDAKPGDIAEHLGIPGGTLRPILKELKDRHIIAERNGRYFVRPISLASIKSELAGDSLSRRSRSRSAGNRSDRDKKANPAKNVGAQARGVRRSPGKKSSGLSARFNKWIDDGFFEKPKTLADVQKRFHKEGEIVPQSKVSPYLLTAVRSGRLSREEGRVNNKQVWTYRSGS